MPGIEMDSSTRRGRFSGALLGLAAGDALGMPLEFKEPGSFEPICEMMDGGLPAGHWTDDTAMALCLAESLIECRSFEPVDQMERYLRWLGMGYMSSTGRTFGTGGTVAIALSRFFKTREGFCGSFDPLTAGNGSLMRLAPVPLFFHRQPAIAIERAGDSSRTTHQAPAAVDACRYLAGLIVGALQGRSKKELLSPLFSPAPGHWQANPLVSEIEAIAAGSFKCRQPPDIRGSGYVVESLEAALWAFYRSSDFEEGCIKAVNLGDDADTTGAIFGQLAGAFYGEEGIPERWLEGLAKRSLIEEMALSLLDLSEAACPGPP